MSNTYKNPVYPYHRAPELGAADVRHCPVVIVGGGPSGLAAAVDLAQQGVASILLDDNNTVSVGSRAICFAKRTLEVMDRLGCAQPMLDKGVTWQLGKVFFHERQVYEFNLLPEQGHRVPAFINLQQYYFEEYLVDRARDLNDHIDLRWKHKVSAVESFDDSTLISVETEDGEYQLRCDHLLVADGANSRIRDMLGLESRGQVFQDRFLIADVVMKAEFPTERWFWFDPPFHPNQSVLLHKQPDNVWRIDFQLGWDADPDEEKKEHNIRPRVQAMLGDDVEFELEWASVYTFRCRKMDHFIHRRVLFIGDAAHQVSPFGARGANGAIQSIENLTWKLARVIKGEAPLALLATYNDERQHGASENLLNSTRSTDFITPKSRVSRLFRDTTLELAEAFPFARSLVNSGRLSLPSRYDDSPLNGDDDPTLPAAQALGAVAKDAPIRLSGTPGWLLNRLGNRFVLMISGCQSQPLDELAGVLERRSDLDLLIVTSPGQQAPPALTRLPRTRVIEDSQGLVAERYGLARDVGYLIRPDQHISARWRRIDTGRVEACMKRALGHELAATCASGSNEARGSVAHSSADANAQEVPRARA